MLENVLQNADDWLSDISKIEPKTTDDIDFYLLRHRTLSALVEIVSFLVDIKNDIKNDRFVPEFFIEDLEDLENNVKEIQEGKLNG